MKSRKNMLLVLSSGGMTLSCFYACTSFILASLSHKPVSVFEAAAILFLAVIITHIHNHRGWRRIYVAGLHLLGLLFSALGLYHSYYRLESPFWSIRWILEFFMLERTVMGWLGLVVILLCVWILWFCGIRLWAKPTNQTTLNHRFDRGLAFLLSLLLIKLLIVVKGASMPMEHSSIKSFFSFMILGLFSMGFVRTRDRSRAGGVTYLKGAGVVFSFAAVTLVLGGGLFILFLPGLQTLAEASYGLLGSVTRPLEWFVVLLSGFFLEMGIRRKFLEEPSGEILPGIDRSGGELGILHYLFIGIAMAILLFMAGVILSYLLKWLFSMIKWLFSETVEEKEKKGLWERLLIYFDTVKGFFSILWIKIFKTADISCTAETFYKSLLRWGRFSGLHHAVTETPKEYGIRLGHRFPRIENEIDLIIHMHDEAVYGCLPPDGRKISRARLAMRRIRNPLLWVDRIKSLCFQNRF
jgi:hypothetical protein